MWNRIFGILLLLPALNATPPALRVAAGAHRPTDSAPETRSPAIRPAAPLPAPDDGATLELVESWPVETTLDHPDIRDAADVWLELIAGATTSLEIAEFYLSDDPQGGGRLRAVVAEVERAARRGVRVRVLVEEAFYRNYPELPDQLGRLRGITVRRLDSKAFSRGILHAKYFIVDGSTVFVGSQNFDWRALDHIQELGLVIRGEQPGLFFRDIFDLDWDLAGAMPPGTCAPGTGRARADSIVAHHRVPASGRDCPALSVPGAGDGTIAPVASPIGLLPDAASWDEPRLLDLIDGAQTNLELQLLTMTPLGRDSTYYPDLEQALRRAAARGVRVRILLSDWCKSPHTVRHLKALALFPRVEIRFMVIPPWSGGFTPFSRTIHAKYLTVDQERFWLGTSNWERNYFHESRNMGVVGSHRDLAGRLRAFFDGNWNSAYVEAVDPRVDYVAPRVGR